MVIDKKQKDNIATLLIIVFNTVLFLRQYISRSQFISNLFSVAALLIGCFMIIYAFTFGYDKNRLMNISFFFLFLYLFGVISSLFGRNYEIQDYFIPFQYFGVGICLLIFRLNHKMIKRNFYALILFFIINIVLGADPTKIFDISRNYISVVLLIYLLLYYVSCSQNNVKISIIPTILCFLISIWAVGRGGIVTFAILFVLIYLRNNFYKKFNAKRFIKQTSLILVVGIIVICFFYDTIISNAISRFSNQGLDSGGRDVIWEEYFGYIKENPASFIFGVPSEETEVLKSLGGNPHNAFFYLHMRYGIMGLILVGLIMAYKLSYLHRNNSLYGILLFIIIVRIFTDSGAFNGPYDPFLYYFLFIRPFNISNFIDSKNEI